MDASLDNLAAIQQHVISWRIYFNNEEGYYHGEYSSDSEN
jgi:hypothetical protein